MIIDDEQLWQSNLRNLISRFGYDAKTAGSYAQAITILESGTVFDLVITDIRLSGFNENEASGFDVIRKLNTTSLTPKKIVITSYHTEQCHKQALELGADYVIKDKYFNDNLLKLLRTYECASIIGDECGQGGTGQSRQQLIAFASTALVSLRHCEMELLNNEC